jgi:hypothetical protein
MVRLIERKHLPGRYDWRTTLHLTLEAARAAGAASSEDFVIEDERGGVIEYRIA